MEKDGQRETDKEIEGETGRDTERVRKKHHKHSSNISKIFEPSKCLITSHTTITICMMMLTQPATHHVQ